jgi:formate dehydrogenase
MAETRTTFCRICEASCGLVATLEEGKVTKLEPNKEHIGTGGFACIKGLNQHKMYDSPDRLQYPLKRTGQEWHRISWEQALSKIGEKVAELRGESPHSVGMYVGAAAVFGTLHWVFAQAFIQAIGSKNMYSSSTQDAANRFASSSEIYGFPFTLPFPDIAPTNKWTCLQVTNPAKRLKQMAARGAKIFFIDPRRTESAQTVGEHLFIRPNTDVYFYLSFLHELFQIDGIDRARAAKYMTGLDQLEALVVPWTPERTEEVTQIPGAELRRLVASYAIADGAALITGTGVGMGTNGTLAVWLQEAINAVSGNLDRKGGMLVGRGVVDFAAYAAKNGLFVSEERSRIGNFRVLTDAFPGGILADEILTPGPDQLRGFFVSVGNPLLSMANSARLRDALRQLELLVVTDIYLNETASLAHYVLPATSPLQRPDLPFFFPLVLGMQSIPYLAATERIVPPDGEQREEGTIYTDLAKASGVNLFGSKLAQRTLEFAKNVHSALHPKRGPSLPQELLLSLALRSTGNGSFKKILRFPNGKPRAGACPDDFLGQRVVTKNGLVQLAPERFLTAAKKLDAELERERSLGSDKFRLITKRSHRTHNSWTQNIPELTSTAEDQSNTLYMHPDDAAMLGLVDNDIVDVTSQVTTVRLPIRFLADLMRGTVAMAHGWGHQHATGLSVASKLRGVNVNLLAADGPEHIEELSGMAHLTGILVEVTPAAGPVDVESWSGITQP